MSDETFAALPPLAERVVIVDETLEIAPLKVGELPAFARALRPLAGKLSAQPDWLGLLADDGEALLDALAIASRRPREWVGALPLDEAIKLAETVFAVNADFFIQRVTPGIVRLGARLALLGQTSSSDSSKPGTATQTS